MSGDIVVTDGWRAAFPGACAGILVLRDARNPATHAELDERKAALEAELRERYGGMSRAELRQLPVLRAYAAYYRRFDKTYHVQLQLESVALKGRQLPSVAALVEAMFMAELRHQLLTAGHDLDTLLPPVRLDVATDPTPYTLANGNPGALKPGDMLMADMGGVICSLLYGQDQRTRLTAETRNVMFVVYAPAGVGAERVSTHLHDIAANVRLVAPEARVEALTVHEAPGREWADCSSGSSGSMST
jgi:DNA/RNA-binding domain of Phe-tRNA-synthetase-like protein